MLLNIYEYDDENYCLFTHGLGPVGQSACAGVSDERNEACGRRTEAEVASSDEEGGGICLADLPFRDDGASDARHTL